MLAYLVLLSILIQLSTAFLALRLISITGKRLSWTFIAIAMVLQASRRIFTLVGLISGKIISSQVDISEWIGLSVSVLMFIGVAGFGTFLKKSERSIRERKLAEEKLSESESKFKKLFDEGPFGMALINIEFRFETVNRTFSEMLGYTEMELQKMTFENITHPEDLIFDLPNIKKLINQEITAYKTEKRYLRRDGQILWGALTVTSNYGNNGQFLYNLAIIEDITPRKLAEDEIRRLNERISTATRASQMGIWDWDVVKNRLVWDEQMYTLYGLKMEKSPGVYETWRNGVHPDDRELNDAITRQSLLGEKEYDTEFRIVWPDESVHWLKAAGQVFFDENGNAVRMVGVNFDITESKLADEELLKSKAKLETALASMTDAVFISDAEGRFIQFNEAFATFHKFSNKEECTKTFAEYPEFLEVFWPNGELTPVEQWAVPRALRGEIALNEEYILRRKDTGEVWIGSYSFAPIRDKAGVITGSVVAGRDITDSKKAEEELKISEERYRNIFESAVIGIYRTTPDGQIILANPTLIKLLEFDSFDELAKRDLEEEGFEDDMLRKKFRESIEKDGFVTGMESVWKTKNGKSVIVNENAKAFYNQKGEVIYYEGTIEDITERKKMEKNLRESEEKFRKAFLTNPDAITITRIKDGMYISANQGFTQIFEYQENEILGKTSLEINMWYNSDDRKEFVSRLNTTGVVENFEVKLCTKSGNIKNCLVSSAVIELEGVTYILSTTKDITERKHIEEALRYNEALLKEVGRIAQVGGWEFDPLTGQSNWTEEVARIHDLDPQTPASVSLSINYYSDRSRPIIEKAFQEVVMKAKPYDLELEIVTAKGNHKWVRTIGHPVVEGGKVIKVFGSFQDITERKHIEIALQKSEDLFSKAFHGSPSPMTIASQKDGTYIAVNDSFLRMLELTPNDVIGKKGHELNLIGPGERAKIMDELRKKGKIHNFEVQAKSNSGKQLNLLTSVENTELAGEPCTIATMLDITDRKLAEEKIRNLNETLEQRVEERTTQLKEANQELEAFSYSVSHDLRAPLRHINGFVDLLTEKYEALLPEQGKHYLETIVDSSKQMGNLIDDLLQFSRTGRQEMRRIELDMNVVLLETIELLKPDAAERNINWEIVHLPRVTGDHSLLRIVWFNLLSNAVKFTKTKEKAVIQIGFRDNEKELIFFVQDNGAGFDMRYAGKLFGVFQRLHSKRDFDGTGIGLANVRRIVSKHGGQTWAESKLNEGSTFYFSLPKSK